MSWDLDTRHFFLEWQLVIPGVRNQRSLDAEGNRAENGFNGQPKSPVRSRGQAAYLA